jgi:2-hydroxychromene-2-carboxylate isomerase
LLAQVLPRLQTEYGIETRVVPVAQPGLSANPAPEMLLGHAMADAAILAESYGLSFPADAKPPPEDRLRRAHAVLLEPRSPSEQAQVAIEVGEAVWRDDGEALGQLVERHGGLSGESVRPALEANYAALERAGHYQPGMLHYGGDWYWGVDRLNHLEARLHREGLSGSLKINAGPSPRLASAIGHSDSDRPSLDVFVSFRSPYSYVAAPQLIDLRERYGIEIKLKPVLPMVMRGLAVPKAKRLYIAHDTKREADRQGIPFGRVCDPLGKGIGYCMAIFFQCVEGRGDELGFFHAITRGAWSEARDIAHIPDLVELAGRAGVSEAEVLSAIGDKTWKDKAQANRDALSALGLWGVPSFRIGDYATWGQDRIAPLEAEIARFCGEDG